MSPARDCTERGSCCSYIPASPLVSARSLSARRFWRIKYPSLQAPDTIAARFELRRYPRSGRCYLHPLPRSTTTEISLQSLLALASRVFDAPPLSISTRANTVCVFKISRSRSYRAETDGTSSIDGRERSAFRETTIAITHIISLVRNTVTYLLITV